LRRRPRSAPACSRRAGPWHPRAARVARALPARAAPRPSLPEQGPGEGWRRSEGWGRVGHKHNPKLTAQGDATAWERWVYLFAQLRQLPALAPHLPTARPRLRQARPPRRLARPPDPMPTLPRTLSGGVSLPNPNPNPVHLADRVRARAARVPAGAGRPRAPAGAAARLAARPVLHPRAHRGCRAAARAPVPPAACICCEREARVVMAHRWRQMGSTNYYHECPPQPAGAGRAPLLQPSPTAVWGAAAVTAGVRAHAQDPRPGRRQRRAAAGGRAPVPAGRPLRPGAGHPAAPAPRRRVRLHHAARPAAAAAPRAHRRARAHRRGVPVPRQFCPLACQVAYGSKAVTKISNKEQYHAKQSFGGRGRRCEPSS